MYYIMEEVLKIMFFHNGIEVNRKNASLNPAPEYERPFRPASELMFSGNNRRNTYSENSIRVGNYDREGRHLYK